MTAAQVPLHLRRARLTRLGMEANGDLCKSFLKTRYADSAGNRVKRQVRRATSTRKTFSSR